MIVPDSANWLQHSTMSSTDSEARGSYRTALEHAARLLRSNPRLAEEQATEILKVFPGAEPASRILASACRMQGRPRESLAILEPLVARNSASPSFQYDWGRTLGSLGRTREAIRSEERRVGKECRSRGWP